ncbi:MAG TPA: type 1 glutamine amidotransferase domain-containing protein [Candidatus Saccharimonadales bacterium]|nr:type 1 glutamine amidotransferase domain-containing protein [Candidatus Saccharimonadales bacterium]
MQTLTGKKIAVLVHNYFEQVELTGPKEALEAAGAEVDIVTANGEDLQGLHHVERGDTFTADLSVEEIAADEYDAVVIPGGVVNADKLRMSEGSREFVKAMDAAGKPVAAICHGPWLLVSSGLVKGRKLTSYETLQDDIRNAGGTWTDQEVVVDGNMITSRKPDDIPAFNEAILQALA